MKTPSRVRSGHLSLVLLLALVMAVPLGAFGGVYNVLPTPSGTPSLLNGPPASASAAPSPLSVSSSPPSLIGTSHAIIPRAEGASPAAINPISIYPKEPAPMGISDMGVNAAGVAYSYDTTKILSNVTFTSQDIYNDSLTDGGARYFTWQMNAFMAFVQGGKTYWWWIQDVATMDTDDRQITFMDCVWNATTASATLPTSGALSGNGSVSGGVYSDDASNTFGANVTTGVAGGFEMIIEASKNAQGEAVVYLGFSDQDTPGYYEDFDTVTWLKFKAITDYEGFVVNGNAYNVWGTAYDAEIMVGGPFNGDFTVAHPVTDITMQIYRWNGHNFESPQATWNFGSETAESISSAQTYFVGDGDGAPGDTVLNGTAHNATTGQLYDQYQVGELSISASSISSGQVSVGADRYPFTGGAAWLTLVPGTYPVWVNSSAGNNALGSCTIVPGVNLSVSVPGTCTAGSGPTISSFGVAPNPVVVGSPVTFTVSATGGVGTLSYAYTGLPAGCMTKDAASLPCTPTVAGTYKVWVFVNDSAAHSASASVTLVVSPSGGGGGPTITAFSATPSSLTLGASSAIAVTATGGTGTLSYAYTGLPPGCLTSDVYTFSCKATATGTFTLRVYVNDTAGHSATATTSLTVNAVVKLVISSYTANPADISTVWGTTLWVNTTGGTAPLAYLYTNLPAGCSTMDVSQLYCAPTTPGWYNATVEVTDSTVPPQHAWGNVTLWVEPNAAPLKISSFVADPNPVTVGTATTLTVTTTGGNSWVAFQYTALPPGCSSASSATLPCTPTAPGTFSVGVNASISDTDYAVATLSLTVVPAAVPLSVSFSVSPSSVALGSSAQFTATGTGGDQPYTFAYSGTPSGCTFGTTGNNSCTPTATGTFEVVVTLTDGAHSTVQKETNLTVTACTSCSSPPSSSSGFLGLSTTDWLVIAAVIVVVAVVAAVLLSRRKSPPQPEVAPWPPPGQY